MSQHPLSSKSSKKGIQMPSAWPSKLETFKQGQIMQGVNKEEYQHILEGERVYIELYYNGRVVETEYNKWVFVMGGILQKRLNEKVKIFITNCESDQLKAVLDRVKTACKDCRVVTILWFQECFKQKAKVAFDDFALDVEKVYETKDVEDNIQAQISKFLTNVAEDVFMDVRAYFRSQQKQANFFKQRARGIIKDKTNIQGNVLRQNQIQQNCDFHNKGKSKSKSKRKKGSTRSVTFSLNSTEEDVSCEEREKSLQLTDQQYPKCELSALSKFIIKHQTKKPFQAQQNKVETNVVSSEKKVKIIYKNARQYKRKVLVRDKQINQYLNNRSFIDNYLRPFDIVFREREPGPRGYKLEMTVPPDQEEMKKIHDMLVGSENSTTFFVVTPSSFWVKGKVKEINEIAVHPHCLRVEFIEYKTYFRYLYTQPPYAKVYFLMDPKQALHKPYFYALFSLNFEQPELVHIDLLDEIKQYNMAVPKRSFAANYSFMHNELKRTRTMMFSFEGNFNGMKVMILNSQLPYELQKWVMMCFDANFLTREQYLVEDNVSVLVGSRSLMKEDPDRRNIINRICLPEEDIWNMMFHVQEIQYHS